VLGFTTVDEQELYGALDWLVEEQERIESVLARRHLKNGTLVLYDVTSTYFEGRTCPLAQFGHDRDGKGKLQLVFGLLCTAEGCPVAVEVFEGNVGDPSTLPSQISKIKGRFELERVVLVGDRGMITEARIRQDVRPADLRVSERMCKQVSVSLPYRGDSHDDQYDDYTGASGSTAC